MKLKLLDRTWRRGRVHDRIHRPFQQLVNPPSEGTNLLHEDWDTLVILDACRADLFTKETETITSVASCTEEWLERTFDENHGDIVYVAGNPMVSRDKPEAFHRLYEAWREGHDPVTSVIEPDAVTQQAIEAREKHPHKRLIVHYMQPHHPFIGYRQLNHCNYHFGDVGKFRNIGNREIDSVWKALRDGLVSKHRVRKAYWHNLIHALREVEDLVSQLDEKVVVTSDHGNAIGEKAPPTGMRVYGHPRGLRMDCLTEVPYIEISSQDRIDIREGDVSSESESTSKEVKERLSDLGYRESRGDGNAD